MASILHQHLTVSSSSVRAIAEGLCSGWMMLEMAFLVVVVFGVLGVLFYCGLLEMG